MFRAGLFCLFFGVFLTGMRVSRGATDAASSEPSGTPLPPQVAGILERHCMECHDSDEAKGGVNLASPSMDWSAEGVTAMWEKTFNVLTHQQMPPVNRDPLSDEEKQTLLSFIDAQLLNHTSFGGDRKSVV
jgi:mono/diheme cytochrome c family protein